jgi:hypothetical protein
VRAALLLAFVACAALPAAASAATIAAKPGLYPAFSPSVHDYASRCQAPRALRLLVHAPARTAVAIDGLKRHRASLHLRAGRAATIAVGSGRYRVRCVPDDFPAWTAERHGHPAAQFYLVTPTLGPKGSRYVVIYDNHGAPVWWMRGKGKPMDAKLLPDGNIAWSFFTNGQFAAYSVPYQEHRLDGTLVRRIAAVGAQTDSHDLQVLPNGDYLVVSYVPRDGVDLSAYGGPANATVEDGQVEEISPRGKVVWTWNTKDHIALDEARPFLPGVVHNPFKLADGREVYDIVHVNGVEPNGNSVLISARQTDAVYKVSRHTGAIEWKLGGTKTPQSLTVTGAPGDSLIFSGQHDPRLQPDGTLTVHDNRTNTGMLPRAVRFRIDAAARTATQVEQLTDPATMPSLCCGSARRIRGGDWVMSWGFNSLVEELDPAGSRVFALHFPSTVYSYRAVPLMPGQISERALRAGMTKRYGRG